MDLCCFQCFCCATEANLYCQSFIVLPCTITDIRHLSLLLHTVGLRLVPFCIPPSLFLDLAPSSLLHGAQQGTSSPVSAHRVSARFLSDSRAELKLCSTSGPHWRGSQDPSASLSMYRQGLCMCFLVPEEDRNWSSVWQGNEEFRARLQTTQNEINLQCNNPQEQ